MSVSLPLHPSPRRRDFLAACAGCAAARLCRAADAPASARTRLRLVFAHIAPDKPSWPYQGYDYEARKRELTARLREACPEIEFLPATALSAEDARKLLAESPQPEGWVVYLIGIWSGAARVIADSGFPVLLVDDLYAGSGEFLVEYARARRAGGKVAGVSSSRFDDVVESVRAFECLHKLRASTILDILDRDPGDAPHAIADAFGVATRTVSSAELNDAWRGANPADARDAAALWTRQAAAVVEPTPAEIGKSGAMYVALRDLLRRHQAQAVTIDCLRLFYDGKLPAYPCLGLFQFNNDGLVGACEADLHSTLTMLLMSYLAGRPGYISDPVLDTSANRIIYAHCVAPSKVYGPRGPASPYHIRNHSEDRRGAAVRSLMPLGEMTTTLLVHSRLRQIAIHQGKTVANVDDDKACRTKLAAEVPDAGALLNEWDRFGWHRVTFYGDWRRPVETIAHLAGFPLVTG